MPRNPQSFAKGSRHKQPDSEATISAMTCYARALAESIREVSDAELDRMIESLGGAVMVQG